MDALPDELLAVVAGECVAVIDALRAVCGRFRRILVVPPLVVDGAEVCPGAGDVKIAAGAVTICRGDTRMAALYKPAPIFGTPDCHIIHDYRAARAVLRDDAPRFRIMVEMMRGYIIEGSFIGRNFSITPSGTVIAYGRRLVSEAAARAVDTVIFRPNACVIIQTTADIVLKLSREDTHDTHMSMSVHVNRVHEFAALGWSVITLW